MQQKSRSLGMKIGLISLVILSIALSPIIAYAAENTKDKFKHPTPELIEAGLKKGAISTDQAYLYLAYALQDDKKIPAKYRGDVPYDGTLLVLRLRKALASKKMKASNTTEISNILDSFCDTPYITPPDPLTNSTSTSHFYIEYGTIDGNLSIDDYVTALETAWNSQIDTFGWAAPPVSSTNPAPNNLYHVRIMDLPPYVYGLVNSIGTYAGFVGDNPNTPWDDKDATATCMVLNNDYSGTDSSSQEVALQATAAHEFNHSIQYGYTALDDTNIQGIVPNDGFVDGSAYWMEDEVFDDANDNYRYLWPGFGDSMSEPSDIYAYWITFRGLTERYGTGTPNGSEQVMQDFWENISKGSSDEITALNLALMNKGTNLSDAFHAYAIAVKFNKPCNQDYVYPYCFEEGNEYVAAAGDTEVHASIANIGESFTTTLAGSYALKWVNLPIGSKYEVSLSNTHTIGELRMSVVCDTNKGFVIFALPKPVRAGEQSPHLSIDTNGCSKAVAVITNQDTSTYLNTSFLLQTYQTYACTEWNLATDFLVSPNQANPNPDSCGNLVWEFMGSNSLTRPASYYHMEKENFTFDAGLNAWHGNYLDLDYNLQPVIGYNDRDTDYTQGEITWPAKTIAVHPGSGQMAVIAWHSPLTSDGYVYITGGVKDYNPAVECSNPDGILWYLDKNSADLAHGFYPNGESQDFTDGHDGVWLNKVPVDDDDVIYLSIHPGENFFCDTTGVRLSIKVTDAPLGIPPSDSRLVDPEITDSDSVDFTVTFPNSVTGVDATDFHLTTTGSISGASVSGVSGSGAIYTVTVNTGSGEGTIRLDAISAEGIFTTGDTYTIDKTPPTVLSIVRASANPTNASSVDFAVTFSEAVTGVVDSSDFALTTTGSISGANVSGVSGSGTTYTVMVNPGSSDGTIRLDVPASATITDLAGNPLESLPFTGGEEYIIAKTAPVLLLPLDGAILHYNRPTFDWTDFSSATGYHIKVSKNSSFTLLVVDADTSASNSTYTPTSNLPANTLLYWRVRAQLGATHSDWSSVWTFTTGNPPSKPTLLAPADNALTMDLTPCSTGQSPAARPLTATRSRWPTTIPTSPAR